MIGYVTIGTNDLDKAAPFFDTLLGLMGGARMMEGDGFIAWSKGQDGAGLGVTKPFDGKPATVGNGVMVALEAKSREEVDTVYKKALDLGARDEGAPGERMEGFYAGYFRDLDGNKFNVFHMKIG
ncbi:glyoxalase [Iodidimonas gelatinilytica]|uniref:Glyoxalase n=1 Tax=Iodidimonas gelatinilytica TaxID=1236966 RepID=A0A5A7MVT5_9PROT|nr:VOC family protein [Iodidimonas gelatinilytica]GEQ98955.1 glyoxalase [Iodidimonas gelatinilytica]GEQ99731.1 glyoxalase [Iodidimonas gelatinilytica]